MSCCTCGQTIKIVLPPGACPDSGTYTASNANVTGEGVFFQQSGNEFQFYGITNEDGYLTVSLDTTNKVIVIGLDEDLIAGSIPDATETVKGKAEIATQAETNAGTDDTRFITPLKLATRVATTSLTGIVELATNAETITGTDTQRATTPAGVKAATDLLKVTQVAANQVAREGAAPAFAGQLLWQRDTTTLYAADTTDPGDWVLAAIPREGTVSIGALTFSGGTINFAGTTTLKVSNVLALYTATTDIQIDDVQVPASSLIGSDVNPGSPKSYPITNFLSEYNIADYGLGTYTESRNLPNSGTATTTQIADFLATLIQDLRVNIKPGISV